MTASSASAPAQHRVDRNQRSNLRNPTAQAASCAPSLQSWLRNEPLTDPSSPNCDVPSKRPTENCSDCVAAMTRPADALSAPAGTVTDMCASYGLDPRFSDPDNILAGDQKLLDNLRTWAIQNDGETLLPTGKHLRNLNPIIVDRGGHLTFEMGWWGYLVGGEPAKFPSINTRSERLMGRRGSQPERAIVPATAWFEMQKPSRQWYQFAASELELLALAAVAQPGRTADGEWFTCYSIVMRPAPSRLAPVHERAPLTIPAAFVDDWLSNTASVSHDLVAEATAESDIILDSIHPIAIRARP